MSVLDKLLKSSYYSLIAPSNLRVGSGSAKSQLIMSFPERPPQVVEGDVKRNSIAISFENDLPDSYAIPVNSVPSADIQEESNDVYLPSISLCNSRVSDCIRARTSRRPITLGGNQSTNTMPVYSPSYSNNVPETGMRRVSTGSGHIPYSYQRVFFGSGNQVRPFIMTEFGIPSSGVFEISVRANIAPIPLVPLRIHLYSNGRMITHTPYQHGGVYTLYKTLMLPRGSTIRLYLEKKSGPPSEARIMGSHISVIRVQ